MSDTYNMETEQRSSVYVAPLHIKKTSNGFITGGSGSIQSSTLNADMPAQQQMHYTPPLTPQSSRERMATEDLSDAPVFHNYLRAFYNFHPTDTVSSSTITLPLNQGDVVLVHSVHTNGWADGTLLETGDRGWLPTNYCEPFEPVQMRHLLKALTDFWDVIRSASLTTFDVFKSQDYIRGLIAGVRFLLEKSKCLTRDTAMIKSHDNLRRVRKALLSDLSGLVKIAKRLQEVANGQASDEGVDSLLDEMLLKAFRIVTRSVTFLDIWTDVSKPSNTLTVSSAFAAAAAAANAPLTPPADGTTPSSTTHRQSTTQSEASTDGATSVTSGARSSMRLSRSLRNSVGPQSCEGLPQVDGLSRTPSERTNRTSISRRVSYHGGLGAVQDFSLVSTHLGRCYDAFLSVLGSFIGLHMQQKSSTELLITTQQAVKACRRLMTIIEAVMKRDSRRPEVIRKAKDHLVDKIMELARAAQHAFRTNANEEVVFMPEDHKRLVDAATACVRSAGECYAHTQMVLEQIGDFEYDAVDPYQKDELASATSADQEGLQSIAEETTSRQSPPRPNAPKLVIPQSEVLSASQNPNFFTAASRLSSDFTPSTDVASDTPATAISIDDDVPPTPPPKTDLKIGNGGFGVDIRDFTTPTAPKTEARVVISTGSTSTFASSIKDSDWSGHSVTSTIATSVDHDAKKDVTDDHLSASQVTSVVDDTEETEEKLLETTFAHELSTKDGRIIGGTLRGLIERLTAFDSTPDSEFVSTFYLTFRLFATPLEFAQALAERFSYIGQSPSIANPVRLRVYNSLKGWLEAHWRHDCDNSALPFIMEFTKTSLIPVLPTAGKRLLELAEKVSVVHGPVVPRLISSIGKTNTSIAQYINPDTPIPAPIISKNQLSLLRSWKENGAPVSITDFDPLELARQFTIKESQIFSSILPEELLATEWTKQSGSLAVNVRMMSTLSTDLASLVADSILQQEDAKKRAAVIKQWIKVANKCLELNNYDSLMAIYCALTNSTITRMKRTWEVVSPKTRALLDTLGAIVDVSKNYTGLRQRLQNLMPPCIPFVGMYLTDLTFVDHGNPATRQLATGDSSISVINFDKHVKTAKIISDLQRFQIPYRLTEIPELQTWMQDQLIRVRSTGDKSFQNFYRRSLVLEPREIPARRTSPIPGVPQPPQNKEKFDFLSWTHSSKDKPISTH